MKGIKKKLLGMFLSLSMVFAIIPSMPMTAFAAGDPVFAETINASPNTVEGTYFTVSGYAVNGEWEIGTPLSHFLTITSKDSSKNIGKLVLNGADVYTSGIFSASALTGCGNATITYSGETLTISNLNVTSITIGYADDGGNYLYPNSVSIYTVSHTCNLTAQSGQAATCTEDGWKDYYQCTGTDACGKIYATNSASGTSYADLAAWKASTAGKTAKLGHDWGYTANGATLTATCTRNSAHTATLTLTAGNANYSGSPIAKATLFGGMDFTAFNNATGLNLSAEDIKIYTAADTSKASALDSVNAAGSYVADLTVDTDKTATLDFTVGRAPNAYTFVYANTVGWDFYPMLAEILKTNGVGGDTITIKNSLESGPAIAVKTSGGPDSDDSWNGSSISCTPGSSTNLTIPTNYVVDMVQLNGLEFVCKLKSVHTHNFTYTASGATLTATCDADGCGLTDKKVSLTLTASDTNYSGIAGSSTPVTFTKVDGSGTLSSTNLGTATKWTYNETAYEVYNGFIPSTSGSSWNDAMGFVNALNDANYDGHTDWTLLSSKEMAKAYAASGTGAMPDSSDRGAVNFLWSSVEYDWSMAYGLYDGDDWCPDYQWSTDSLCGFVVLRPASGSTGTPTNKIVTVGNDTERAAWKAALGDDSIPEVHYVSRTGSPTTLADTTTEPTTKGRYTASISAGSPAVTASVDFDIIDKHAHSFTYSADGAVLTATCNHSGDLIENCDLANNKVSLTLTASSANYSGSAVTASYGNGEAIAWETAVGTDAPAITYEYKATAEGTYESKTDTKNVGYYKASATVGGKTASVEFKISKVDAALSNTPVGASNLKYTGSELNLLETAPTCTGAGVKYVVATTNTTTPAESAFTATAAKETNAGTYYVYYLLEGDANHYSKICETPIEVTIAKATPDPASSLFAMTAPSELTYSGTAKTATVDAASGITGLGTISVKYYDSQNNEVVQPTNAGTYTVKASAAVGENYNAVADVEIGTFTIQPKPITLTWSEITTVIYNGTEQTIGATIPDGAVCDGDTVNVTTTKVTNAGDAQTIEASLDNDNYSISNSTQSLTVNPKVTLQQGGEVKYTATNTGWNAGKATFNFEGQEIKDGDYNLVVEFGNKTVTQIVKYGKDITPPSDITPPTESVQAVVKTEGEKTPAVVVDGLDAVALAEKRDGHIVTVEMTVTSKDKAEIAEAEVNAIKEKVNGKNVEYLDVQIEKFVDSTHDSYIHNTSNLIKIVVPFQTSGRTGFKVVRYHDSAAQVLTELKDGDTATEGSFRVDTKAGTITIYAKQFSTYAVAYSYVSSGSYTPGHTVTSDLKSVTKVTIDGKVVDSRYYTVSGGNIILSGEFMKTLTNGKHTVKLYDGAKVATGIMTVSGNVAVISAATGDMGVALYAALSVSSILGMGWVGKKKRDDE